MKSNYRPKPKFILNETVTNEKLLYNSLIPYKSAKFVSENYTNPDCSYLRDAYYGMMRKCNTGYHTYQDWKNLGLFDLMSNGFDIMLDDERIEDHEDVRFIYNPETNQYDNVSSGLTIDLTELALSFVTHIGGSNIDDICVPTVWIHPNEKWYEKHKNVFENL